MRKRKLLAAAAALCMAVTACVPQAAIGGMAVVQAEETTTVIDASEYGVSPEATDNAEAIQAVLAAAKEVDGPVTVSFPKGTYQIYPDKAAERELYISNTVGANQSYKMKKIGFLLEDMHDVTIEGNGSLFMFHGKMTTFAAIDCTNIQFQNYEFDFYTPSVVDITVESVEGNTAVVYVPECYGYEINGTNITWKCDASPYTGQVYWTASNALQNIANQTCDLTTGLTRRETTPLFQNLSSIEDMGNHRLKFQYRSIGSGVRANVCYQMRNTTRDHAGMFFWKSKDITLDHVDVHFLYGFGIVGQHSENITMRNMNFEAMEGNGRTTVGFADFIQMSGCKGHILVEGCTFANPHDDPINIHGTFNQVVQRIADNKFKVRYMHHETAGFPNFFVGDEVEFMTKGNMIPVENSVARVTAVEGPTGNSGAASSGTNSLTDIIITLDRDIPASVTANNYVVENITYTPSVLIQDNLFKETPTRGILVTTRKKVEIKNNTFDGMGMASIYISNDAQGWYESGPVRDVTIEGNTFVRPAANYAAIFVEPTNPTVSTERTVHENINIKNNLFYMQNGQVLNAKSVKDLTFTENQIYRYDPEITLTVNASSDILREGKTIQLTASGGGRVMSSNLYQFNGCKNVTIGENVYDGGLKLNATTQNMGGQDITVQDGEGVVVNGEANVLPTIRNVQYESSDESILKINEDGTAIGLKPGTVMVKAFIQAGTERYESNEVAVTVTEQVKPEDNACLSSVVLGDGLRLNGKFDPEREQYTGATGEEQVSLSLQAEEKDVEIEVIADGKSVAKGMEKLDATIPMHGGENKIFIRMTSRSGERDKIYEFTIMGSQETYLSDLNWDESKSSAGYGDAAAYKDRTIDGNKLSLKKEDGSVQTFEKGISSHASCTLVYDIGGMGYTDFSAYVGIDQEITNRNEPDAVFRIYGDGVLLAESQTMNADTPMERLDVSVEGVKELKLVADMLEHNWSDHVDFADAKLSFALSQTETVHTVQYQAVPKKGGQVSAEAGGTKTENGFIAAADGESIKLQAEENEGYKFLGWYDKEGTKVSGQTSFVVENITAGRSYIAKFESEKKPDGPVKGDNASLVEKIREMEGFKYDLNNFTEESAARYRAALEAGKKVAANPNATQAEIDKALKELQDAQNALEKKPEEIRDGGSYKEGNYYYKVTSVAKKTASVIGLANKGLTKITIYNKVKLGKDTYNITSVKASAFKNQKKITSVTIGKNVASIEKNAFMGCTKLKTVKGNSTKLKSIGAKAFRGCKKLKNITIKSKVLKSVGKNAFQGIYKKAVIKVPAKKYKAYTKLLAKKGQPKSVKIKK